MATNPLLTATATFGQLIGDILSNAALSSTGQRQIGNLSPHITIQEVHGDELQITQHPVETGTPITDHCFPMPYTVEISCGWSNSTAGTDGFVQAVYAQLIALQVSRKPFSVRTGKRSYQNMLLRSVGVKTDPESEFILAVNLLAQQIVITSTQQTSAATAPNSDGNSNVAQPVGTGGAGKPGELGTGGGGSGDGVPVGTGGAIGGGKPGELGTPGSASGGFGPTNPGEISIDGGANAAPATSITPDSAGAFSWPNDPSSTGTLSLTPSPAAPSWQGIAAGLQ